MLSTRLNKKIKSGIGYLLHNIDIKLAALLGGGFAAQ
jgi:hypothetical protein